MQSNVISEKHNDKRVNTNKSKYEIYDYSSMTVKPYYRERLKALAGIERRTMISYFEEWADEYFTKRKSMLEKMGLEVNS